MGLDAHQPMPPNCVQLVGAFLGAVFMWLTFLPHFKTVPEPPAAHGTDNLLRSRDALPQNVNTISSYNTQGSTWNSRKAKAEAKVT
jgi:hypothetical protein